MSSILRNEGVVTRRIRRRKRSKRRRRRRSVERWIEATQRNATRVGKEGKEGGRGEKRRWTLA